MTEYIKMWLAQYAAKFYALCIALVATIAICVLIFLIVVITEKHRRNKK